MTTTKIPVAVDIDRIFEAICRDTQVPIVPMALQIIHSRLRAICERAVEINDAALLEELRLLGLVEKGT